MNPHYLRLPLLTASLLAVLSNLSAQTVNWDGSGNSDASGSWLTDGNWAGDVAPSTTAITAGLVNVTSGTRTISINNGETVTAKNLLFTQSTAGASNVLSIASGGTLQLGGGQTWAAPTAGTSRVELGGLIDFTGLSSGSVTVNTAFTFTNAGAVFRSSNTSGNPVFNFNGAVNVNAGAGTAQITYTSTRIIAVTFGSTSTLAVNTGTLEVSTQATTSGANTVSLALQGTSTLSSGAEIKLSTPVAGSGSAGVVLTNSGTLTQGGKVTMNGRGNNVAALNTLTNSNIWKVSGLAATIDKATNNNANNPTFVNTSTASFTGSTAADKITYNHLQTPGTDLVFTNSGIIAAGNGSNGSGLTSVGTLTLVDFAVTNSVSTSSLTFDIGGTTGGQFDVLALQSSSLALTNATLAINLVNGFAPSSSFSVDILTSDAPSSISGSFIGLTVNGSANSDYSFSYNNTTGIGTLSYTASSIPEPSTYAITAGMISLGMVALRRRGKNVSN